MLFTTFVWHTDTHTFGIILTENESGVNKPRARLCRDGNEQGEDLCCIYTRSENTNWHSRRYELKHKVL